VGARGQASRVIGVSKGTLESDLLYLRFGVLYRFDFKGNQEEAAKVLKQFVDSRRRYVRRATGLKRLSSGLEGRFSEPRDFERLLESNLD